MEVNHVIPTGAIVRFWQYDELKSVEIIYGKSFALERKVGENWEPVPVIIENAAFTDEGYPIPIGGEASIETNWDWIYGTLSPGIYRIEKTVVAEYETGNKVYTLYAQFLIA